MRYLYQPFFEKSPALKLLRSPLAPFILGFLLEAFKESGLTQIAEEDLEVILDEHLQVLRRKDPEAPARDARNYLTQWCGDECRYLRKFFVEEKASYVYQLTRHSEKALSWLEDLRRGEQRGYTTSESRYSRILGELRRLSKETNANPQERIRELLAQRDELDAEIHRIRETGEVATLQPQQVKDMLHDLESMLSGFLADFREIEDNFKQQAREIHELYLQSDVSKGDLIEHALNADDLLRGRDQGRSYFGFRQSLRSVESREELQQLIEGAASLALAQGLESSAFDNLVRRLFSEVASVQDSYRKISSQLRRVVEEHSVRETRYLIELLGEVRALAYQARAEPPEDPVYEWEENLRINNVMEVGFWEPPPAGVFGEIAVATESEDEAWRQVLSKVGKPLDLPRYRKRVEEAMVSHSQLSLRELIEKHPLENGVVDLVGYLVVAAERKGSIIHQEIRERFDLNRPIQPRFAELDQVIFTRS